MYTLKPFGKLHPGCIKISLGDRNPEVAAALAAAFEGVPEVEVVAGNLLDLACDAVLSPANSFGDIGGGIDKAIDDFHRGEAQCAVINAIASQFFGELPVGAALVVRVSDRRVPFVVASPTMRVPGVLAGQTINAYLSMRAALVAVLRHNAGPGPAIRSLAVPGLCTGVGGMPYDEASRQMRTAYDNVIGGEWRRVIHPALAPYATCL
jgi:O-acetyl-ADP-ribose deacetylase (regulator of RNase III)